MADTRQLQPDRVQTGVDAVQVQFDVSSPPTPDPQTRVTGYLPQSFFGLTLAGIRLRSSRASYRGAL